MGVGYTYEGTEQACRLFCSHLDTGVPLSKMSPIRWCFAAVQAAGKAVEAMMSGGA